MFPVKEIHKLKDQLFTELTHAVKLRDAPQVDRLNNRVQRLDALLRAATGVNEKFERLTKEITRSPGTWPGEEARCISIELTSGMIKNHMLVITPYTGQIDDQESMRVITRFSAFDTTFTRAGNKLKQRSGIRKFFEGRKVKGGDVVILQEIETGKWYLDTASEFARLTPVATASKSGLVRLKAEGFGEDSKVAEVILCTSSELSRASLARLIRVGW
jgi:hypothetical protein